MMQRLALLFMSLAILMGAASARADRDIVYAARYYLKPGSSGKSHFHLYRINPDGSGRKQLTFGAHDDQYPKWSPDGKQILFFRDTDWDRGAVCVLTVSTGRIFKILQNNSGSLDDASYSPDGRYIAVEQGDWEDTKGTSELYLRDRLTGKAYHFRGASFVNWSSDSRKLYMSLEKQGKKWFDLRSHQTPDVKPGGEQPLDRFDGLSLGNGSWIEKGGSQPESDDGPSDPINDTYLIWHNRQGKIYKRIKVHYESHDEDVAYSYLHSIDYSHLYVATRTSGRFGNFYLMDTKTGKTNLLCQGEELVWAPHDTRFAVVPYRDLMHYDSSHGQERQVWFAPLRVGDAKTRKLRNIVSGLVCVYGCDWRKASPDSKKQSAT